jgi:hypothetical protein
MLVERKLLIGGIVATYEGILWPHVSDLQHRDAWWPDVSDLLHSEKAIRYAVCAAVVVVCVTVEASETARFARAIIIEASFWAAIAFGIHRKSRAAAVAGLILYIGDRVCVVATGW